MWKVLKIGNPLHTRSERYETDDIDLNATFYCEETQPTPEDNIKTSPKSGTSTSTSASLQPGTLKHEEEEKGLETVAEQILHQR